MRLGRVTLRRDRLGGIMFRKVRFDRARFVKMNRLLKDIWVGLTFYLQSTFELFVDRSSVWSALNHWHRLGRDVC